MNVTMPNVTEYRSLPAIVTIGFLLSAVTILTVLGNLLVVLTVRCQRRLRCARNYWIGALAITDLLLGCFVLPFSTINTTFRWWPMGAVFCNIYMSFDVMLCTVSILILFAISLDRHVAVSRPLRYAQLVTKRRVIIIVSGIMLFSFVLAFLPIHLGWNTQDGQVQNTRPGDAYMCTLGANKVYVLFVAIGTYFTPLIIMCVVYVRLFMVTKRQVKQINRLMKSSECSQSLKGGKNNNMSASETKATIALSSIILCFTVCWVPYFILFIVRPFLHYPVNIDLDEFVLWLGYVNSTVNPLLYAFCSTEFRGAFKRMLCHRNCGGNQSHSSEGTMV